MNQISAQEAFERIDDEDFVVLDVREPFEVDTASVEKYVNIPMQQVPGKVDELPQDKTIAVLCHTGGRSGRVTQFLMQQGFDNVVNIAGGIEDWATKTSSATPQYRKSYGEAWTI